MLKLNASYSKKVPAESEYSSQSYHASIELELPDGLSQNEIKARIHSTFELVKDSVENEITKKQSIVRNKDESGSAQPEQASPKQIKYLLDLARQYGLTLNSVLKMGNVKSTSELSRKQCSSLIDEISGKAA